MQGSLRAFLTDLLGIVRRAGDTPLESRVDGVGLAHAALGVFRTRFPPMATSDPDAVAGTDRLNDILATALRDEDPPWSGPAEEVGPSPPTLPDVRTLAAWIEYLCTGFRSIDPRAVDIVALRLEGWTDPEIAGRLAIGSGLVRRISLDALLLLGAEVAR